MGDISQRQNINKMYKAIAILLVALAAIDFGESRGGRCQSRNNPYCKLDSWNTRGADHTLCKYCGVNTEKCGKLDGQGITDEAKTILVETHNSLRRKVAKGQESRGSSGPQPGAANMNELVWDDEVAKIAQMWADQCTFNHTEHDMLLDGMYCGQNLAMAGGSRSKSSFLELRVQDWYDEVNYFPKEGVKSWPVSGGSNGEAIGHYTQIVWGATTKLGCGYTRGYKEILVCNYCTGGNMIGAEVYKAGPAASQCPKERPNKKDGLCSE